MAATSIEVLAEPRILRSMTTEKPEPSASDVELMLDLQNGNDGALSELIQRWQAPLQSFIYRYVLNHADAADLTQEAFVKVYQNRRRYLPKAKFSTWLFAIATNLCRNRVRWRRRHPSVPLESPREEGGEPVVREEWLEDQSAVHPAAAAGEVDAADAVKEAINALPHDLKTAILLFQFEDLSYQEIADVLGCSPKAVETRLYRARAQLKKKLSWLLRDESGEPMPVAVSRGSA